MERTEAQRVSEAEEQAPALTDEAKAHGYDPSKYERPSVTVDIIIMSLRQGDLQVLLIKRRSWPFEGMWAITGGFVNMEESLETAAKRELREETGVEDVYLEQLYTFGDPGRDPRTRVITVVYFALLDSERLQVRAADDAVEVGWFSVYDLPPLAFDHAQILQYALERLRGTSICSPNSLPCANYSAFTKLSITAAWINVTSAKRFSRQVFWRIRARRKWRGRIVQRASIALIQRLKASCNGSLLLPAPKGIPGDFAVIMVEK